VAVVTTEAAPPPVHATEVHGYRLSDGAAFVVVTWHIPGEETSHMLLDPR
jgi:hypothetical protein